MTRLLAGLLIVTATVTAFAAVSARDIEQKLRTQVAQKWSTSGLSIKVTPYASQARTNKGQFAEVKLAADVAERKDKHIRIVDLSISAKDVSLDLPALLQHNDVTVRSRKLGSCHVKLMETDVNRLLTLKKTAIDNLHADFGNGAITFAGKYRFNIKLTGTLFVKNGYEVHFKPTQASIGVLGVPAGIVSMFLSRLNPIIDMRDVPLQPQLKSISITPRFIQFTG